MKRVCLVTLLCTALFVRVGTASGQQLQVSSEQQEVVARLLFSQDRTEAWNGLRAAQQIPPAEQSDGLRGALDPRAIPTLAEAIYGGKAAADALAKNGDAAVPAIVRAVTSETAHYNAVDFGLTALKRMLEMPRETPLSQSSRISIRAAVLLRLEKVTSFTTLWKAIDVAPLVGGPDVLQALGALAESTSAIRALGIDDNVVVQQTQARARQRLGLLPR